MRFGILGVLLLLCLSTPLLAKVHYVAPVKIEEIKQLKASFDASPNSQEQRFELAMAFAMSGFIERGWNTLKDLSPEYAKEVVVKYEALVEAEPKNWEHVFKLAFGYYFVDEDSKDQSRAKAQFKKVLTLNPRHVWSMGFIALIEGLEKQHKVAISWCKKALKIEPNAMAIHALLALGYHQTGQLWEAFKASMVVGRLKTEYAVSGYDF